MKLTFTNGGLLALIFSVLVMAVMVFGYMILSLDFIEGLAIASQLDWLGYLSLFALWALGMFEVIHLVVYRFAPLIARFSVWLFVTDCGRKQAQRRSGKR